MSPNIFLNTLFTSTLNTLFTSTLNTLFTSTLHTLFTSTLNILFTSTLNTLFTSTHSLCFSLNVRGQVSYSYKTTEKIALPYILAFILLDSKQQDTIFWTNDDRHFKNLICSYCLQPCNFDLLVSFPSIRNLPQSKV